MALTIRPWHENGHAIVSATFAIDFTGPPPQPVVRELQALHSKFRDRYPRRREGTGAIVEFQADGGLASELKSEIISRKVGGLIFDSLLPDGRVERAIELRDNRLWVTRSDYAGWETTWPEVWDVFQRMLPIIMQNVNVVAFHLQYHDRFVWSGDRTNFRADVVFRRGSEYLAGHIFDAPDLWHSYTGFFEYRDEPDQHQLLQIVEAQAVNPEQVDEGIYAEIKLNYRAIPGAEHGPVVGAGKPLTDVKQILGDGDEAGLLDDYMNTMHNAIKALLQQVLNDEMCKQIRLFD
jgi:uncharacterized protein (TIGR04255 family)